VNDCSKNAVETSGRAFSRPVLVRSATWMERVLEPLMV